MIKINPKIWPIGITLSIIGVAGLCVWTIKIAQSLPVEMDNTYFVDYRDVDTNANKMILSQKAFDERYSVNFEVKDLVIGENKLDLTIVDKTNTPVDNAVIDLVITRPHTTQTDKNLKVLSHEKGLYRFEPFVIEDQGRWQIQAKTTINNLISYNKFEVNATH